MALTHLTNTARARCLCFEDEITRENREFQLENQMVRAIPFGKLQKIWAVIWGDIIFLLFWVSLADVNIFYSDTHSRNFAFNCFMFMPEISNQMVFVNGKHPSFCVYYDYFFRTNLSTYSEQIKNFLWLEFETRLALLISVNTNSFTVLSGCKCD